MTQTYQKARTYIYRNARPLELARWQFLFEGGDPAAVLRALSFYQNKDGGFGHALEPDAWNPESTPIQTWVATDILREIGFADGDHPLVRGILAYLESGRDFDGSHWYKIVRSNALYPHAPWWQTDRDTTQDGDYNPTACLAGFILRFAPRDGALYALGVRIAREAIGQLLAGSRENAMHTLYCYRRLFEDIDAASAQTLFGEALTRARTLLARRIGEAITQETAQWDTAYICRPSRFIDGPQSVYYPANSRIAQFECDYIVRTQRADGAWDLTWRWDAYPDEWAVSANWWRCDLILSNLLYLRDFGKI